MPGALLPAHLPARLDARFASQFGAQYAGPFAAEGAGTDGGLALYRAIAEQLPHGALFAVDRDLRYLLARGASLREAGHEPADFEGRLLHEALPPELVAHYEPDYRSLLAGMPLEREHGVNGRAFASQGIPIAASDGTVHAALVVSYDVTERRLVEKRLALLDAFADARAWHTRRWTWNAPPRPCWRNTSARSAAASPTTRPGLS
ncbi:PAS domain-containing protein [Massilia sp. Dwa41.01b]|nr:PAS domain-containing protein [Massilia sp. Dwa41.01b]